jgi:hypothetical protein
MSLADKLKARGFEAEANKDGEFKPLKGTYECKWRALRWEHDENNSADFVQIEIDVVETIEGDTAATGGDYANFKKRVYLDLASDDDRDANKAERLANDVFTASGVDLDFASKDAMTAQFEEVISKPVYVRAWGWTPEKAVDGTEIPKDERKARQMFSIIKEAVAEKKRSANSVAF